MLVCCYIGLGSNLDSPYQQLRLAVEALKAAPGIQFEAISPLYSSAAVGLGNQPDYCNAVAKIHTDQTPQALLATLLEIEKQQGRKRTAGQRWTARTLDLDILLYGDMQVSDNNLVIPHREMHKRNFVLKPLGDLAPELTIPGLGPVAELLAEVGEAGLRPWSHAS